uniref:AATF-Che1 domain-containing protein n=1 Tax=Angiostrongylus cantonensis TaxID=6313 RepID=A0A0K0DBB8_ANGCA
MIGEDDEFVGDQNALDSGVDNSISGLGSSFDEDEEQDSQSPAEEDPTTINSLMNNIDKDKQKMKGLLLQTFSALSVYEQTRIWEQLLYIKIKVHAALRAFNQLPRGQLANNLTKEADEDVVSSLRHAHKNAVKLASTLLEAEHLLSSSLTKSAIEGEGGTEDSNDEEIGSSEDEEGFQDDCSDEDDDENITGETRLEEQHVTNTPHAPSINMKSLSKCFREKEQQFVKFRDSTLLKWEERTKFIESGHPKNANSDFSAFEKNNIVSRIEKICADKDRLLKRSRTKKSDIERIGGTAEAEEDDEIYDDDDFYQMLLKELIDKKTSNTRDPVAMTRYLPIAKLVNFHPAMPEMVEWNSEARNELFKSIFS